MTSADSMMVEASIIICAHNPRTDYFARVLEGLRGQLYPLHKWELLVVDNGSRTPLASNWDISWHPNARHHNEAKLGLAWARRRGIEEASGELIIFVDDDNVLDEDYIAEAIEIGRNYPFLGTWGSGCIRGEFETEPSESIRSWLPVRESSAPRWSNLAGSHLFGISREEAIPWGAGLCVRKRIASAYAQYLDQSSISVTGHQGDALSGGDDFEISFVCCRYGLGVGIFPKLKLTHLIPQRRLTDDYLARFAEETQRSHLMLRYKWGDIPRPRFDLKMLLSVFRTIALNRGVTRNINLALVRGTLKAKKSIGMDLRRDGAGVRELPMPEVEHPLFPVHDR